jgi:hypothetical protein
MTWEEKLSDVLAAWESQREVEGNSQLRER